MYKQFLNLDIIDYLNSLKYAPYIISVTKSRMENWTRTWRREMQTEFRLGSLIKEGHLQGLGIDGRITLK